MINNKFLILILNFACILCIDYIGLIFAFGGEESHFCDVIKIKNFSLDIPVYTFK